LPCVLCRFLFNVICLIDAKFTDYTLAVTKFRWRGFEDGERDETCDDTRAFSECFLRVSRKLRSIDRVWLSLGQRSHAREMGRVIGINALSRSSTGSADNHGREIEESGGKDGFIEGRWHGCSKMAAMVEGEWSVTRNQGLPPSSLRLRSNSPVNPLSCLD